LKEEALDRTMWRNRFGRGFGHVVWQITDDDDDDYSLLIFACMEAPLKFYALLISVSRTQLLISWVANRLRI